MRPKSRFLVLSLWIAAVLMSSPAWSADDLQGSCTPGPTTLCLLGSRFSVEVDWEDFQAQTGDGQVLTFSSDDTGFFWFSDAARVDTYVRMIDGTSFNGFFWVFFASLTNFEYTITVTDTLTNGQVSYTNPLGSFTSVTDIMAIEDIPLPIAAVRRSPTAGAPLSKTSHPVADPPDKGTGGTCLPSATTLCLEEGRFQVEVEWALPELEGGTGSGMAVPLTDESGYYWFFSPSSIEMAVKLHDGGDGFFWFFSGATSNVEYTITVADTCAGTVNTYFNPQGNLTSFGDFTAFPSDVNCGIFADGFESGDVSMWSGSAGG